VQSLNDSVVIQAPLGAVFSYVTEPTKMAEWLPSMMEVCNVIGSGEGQQYEWRYKLAGMLFHGQGVVVSYVPNERSVHQTIGAVHSLWTFRVDPAEGGTRFSLDVEYEVPLPVLGKLAERVIATRDARAVALALANAKDTLEA
jgi:uncharacterized protein YndB with AHSA1/START domain